MVVSQGQRGLKEHTWLGLNMQKSRRDCSIKPLELFDW